jgi:hypothetical protein
MTLHNIYQARLELNLQCAIHPNQFLLIAQSIQIIGLINFSIITCYHCLNIREDKTQYASYDIA